MSQQDQMPDIDAAETQEWVEALAAVIVHEGVGRGHDPGPGDYPQFEQGQKIEEPDAEGDAGADEVHEADDREVEVQVERRGAPVELHRRRAGRQGDLREARLEVADDVEEDDGEGDGAADPEDARMEDRRQGRGRILPGRSCCQRI